jgi:hypothetical protein
VARENERNLGAGLQQSSHQPLTGDAEAAADLRGELPTEHEDAHRKEPSAFNSQPSAFSFQPEQSILRLERDSFWLIADS